MAHATVIDPPSWLKRGTRASFAFGVVQRRILSRGATPAEPGAEVLGLRQAPARSEAAAEVFYGGGVIRRPAADTSSGVR